MKLLLAILFVFACAWRSEACSCMFKGDPKHWERNKFCGAPVVIRADVLSGQIEPKSGLLLTDYAAGEKEKDPTFSITGYVGLVKHELQIQKVYRGEVSLGKGAVYTNAHDAMCGAYFVPGHTYLIYGRLKKGKILTNMCRGSHVFTDGDDASFDSFNCGPPPS